MIIGNKIIVVGYLKHQLRPDTIIRQPQVVDNLIKGGNELLHDNPEYQRLVSDLGGNIREKN